jgi:hypothetical protein
LPFDIKWRSLPLPRQDAAKRADAVTPCNRFGSDITLPEFWRSSLDIIRGQIEEFEAMADIQQT